MFLEKRLLRKKDINTIATRDGIFIPNEGARIEGSSSVPFLDGVLEISTRPEIGELLGNNFHNTQGRSAYAQVGINTVPGNEDPYWNTKANKLEVPIEVHSHGIDREKWLEELLKNNQYELGRLIFTEEHSALTEEQVKEAFKNNDISIGNEYKIHDDGSVDIKLSPFEYILSEYQVRNNHDFKKLILEHSRNALMGTQDIVPLKEGETIKPDSLFIGGIALSSGKYSVFIDPKVSNSVKHLEGGTFLDAFRATGINSRLGKNGMRQVELFNEKGVPEALDDLWIKIRLYPSDIAQKREEAFWNTLSPEQRSRIHENGTNLVQVANINQEEVLEALFHGITQSGDTWGRVITTHGDLIIPKERTPMIQASTAESVITDPDGRRRKKGYSSETLQSFGENLRFAKDQGRILVSHEFPSSTGTIDNFVQSGMRCFVFKSLGENPDDPQNVYMSPEIHSKIWELSKQGVSFYFQIEGNGGTELREFYKGFWVTEENKDRFDKVDTVINMYGWHGKMIENLTKDEVREYFKGLIKIYGVERLAVAHGKGPGFMAVADEVARELGILSIGIGISVEKIGQGKVNLAPEAILDFPSSARLYRADLLDKICSFADLNIGGNGTDEERAIRATSTKLGEYLPLPIIYIDVCDGNDHLWEHSRLQQEEFSSTKTRSIKGDPLPTNQYPLAKKWLPNIQHYVKSYEEALKVISEFNNDPLQYWENAGVSKDEIKIALQNHRELADQYERPTPEYLTKAAESYILS